jgi:hypothetical protein
MKIAHRTKFATPDVVSSVAIVAVIVLFLYPAHGENVTTLDGKTYTNITAIANYPKQKQVFFECNSNRISVAITNLPEEFRIKYQIKIPTNIITASAQQPNSASLNLFLAQHSNSELSVESKTDAFDGNKLRTWTIKVTANGFELWSGTVFGDNASRNWDNQQFASFKFNQEAFVVNVLDKIIEWGNIASAHKAESFEKPIGSLPDDILGDYGVSNGFNFYWDKDSATAGLRGSQSVSRFHFDQKNVVNFLKLMQSLPTFKQELVNKIKDQEAQRGLFK